MPRSLLPGGVRRGPGEGDAHGVNDDRCRARASMRSPLTRRPVTPPGVTQPGFEVKTGPRPRSAEKSQRPIVPRAPLGRRCNLGTRGATQHQGSAAMPRVSSASGQAPCSHAARASLALRCRRADARHADRSCARRPRRRAPRRRAAARRRRPRARVPRSPVRRRAAVVRQLRLAHPLPPDLSRGDRLPPRARRRPRGGPPVCAQARHRAWAQPVHGGAVRGVAARRRGGHSVPGRGGRRRDPRGGVRGGPPPRQDALPRPVHGARLAKEMHEIYDACARADRPLVLATPGAGRCSPHYRCDTDALCAAFRVERVLADHPRLQLVVPHLGFDEIDGYERLLERHDNLWLDTTMAAADYFPIPYPSRLLRARPERQILHGSRLPQHPLCIGTARSESSPRWGSPRRTWPPCSVLQRAGPSPNRGRGRPDGPRCSGPNVPARTP